MADYVNEKYKSEGLNKSISQPTANKILNEILSKPIKCRKAFLLTPKQKAKREIFANEIIKRQIGFNDIFWSDECKFVLISDPNNQVNQVRFNVHDRSNIDYLK